MSNVKSVSRTSHSSNGTKLAVLSRANDSTVAPKSADAKESAERARTDQALQQAISATLKKLHIRVRVEVRDSFVKIEGTVGTFRKKERLHRFIMGLSGVKALKDLVKVQPSETVSDRQIALHIRQALDAHSELPPGTAVVQVEEGVACLKGHVRSAEERFVAENVASHCRGVSEVVNELKVDPLEELTDEATARAVKGALAFCEDFETDGVSVSCANGQLSLRGKVPTLMDRALAEEVARLQAGVRRVENRIQVCESRKRRESDKF